MVYSLVELVDIISRLRADLEKARNSADETAYKLDEYGRMFMARVSELADAGEIELEEVMVIRDGSDDVWLLRLNIDEWQLRSIKLAKELRDVTFDSDT